MWIESEETNNAGHWKDATEAISGFYMIYSLIPGGNPPTIFGQVSCQEAC